MNTALLSNAHERRMSISQKRPRAASTAGGMAQETNPPMQPKRTAPNTARDTSSHTGQQRTATIIDLKVID